MKPTLEQLIEWFGSSWTFYQNKTGTDGHAEPLHLVQCLSSNWHSHQEALEHIKSDMDRSTKALENHRAVVDKAHAKLRPGKQCPHWHYWFRPALRARLLEKLPDYEKREPTVAPGYIEAPLKIEEVLERLPENFIHPGRTVWIVYAGHLTPIIVRPFILNKVRSYDWGGRDEHDRGISLSAEVTLTLPDGRGYGALAEQDQEEGLKTSNPYLQVFLTEAEALNQKAQWEALRAE